MIYGFLKQNSRYFTEDEQKKSIEEYLATHKLKIDRWLLDNYKNGYSEIYNIKRGMGTGAYIFSLQKGDMLLCYSICTLCYSYKTALFLLKTAVDQGAIIYFTDKNTKVDHTYKKSLDLLYAGICEFDEWHKVNLFKNTWLRTRNRLKENQEEVIALVKEGVSEREIIKKFHTSVPTFRKFIKQYPELEEEYAMKNHFYQIKSRSIFEQRALLPKRVAICKRKADSLIEVPEEFRLKIEGK